MSYNSERPPRDMVGHGASPRLWAFALLAMFAHGTTGTRRRPGAGRCARVGRALRAAGSR